MDIWHGLHDLPEDLDASVITIGVFDGIHRGHQALIGNAKKLADELGVPCVVVTFDPHPMAVLRPDKMPPLLSSIEERAALVEALGADALFALSFNADMARLKPEEFFRTVLQDRLHARGIVVGENFTFGHKAQGTTQTLRELGEKYGVQVQIVPLLNDAQKVLCSTLIRGALADSDIRTANWALGRRFTVQGEVVRGAGRGGRELGFPTANLYFPDSVALPADGVYAGWLSIHGHAPIEGDMEARVRYPAAISVGTNPTFGDERRSVESFVLDREADLYGHTVRVEFVDHIRGMEKFNSVKQLLEAIGRDVERTREILADDRESTM